MDIWQANDDHVLPTDWSLGVVVFWLGVLLIVAVVIALLLRRK